MKGGKHKGDKKDKEKRGKGDRKGETAKLKHYMKKEKIKGENTEKNEPLHRGEITPLIPIAPPRMSPSGLGVTL